MPHHPGPPPRWWLACALFAFVLTGCAGYKLGPTQGRTAGASSVQILPFENRTVEPRLVDSIGNSVRKAVQQDGTFRLETRDDPDIVLSGVITTFHRSFLSLDPRDVITPRDYELIAVARVKAMERSTSKVLFDKEIGGRTTVRVSSDVNSAERRAVPILAEVLARKTVSLLADGDW